MDLPADHKAVFKALTDYRWVDRTEAYTRLGYFGDRINAKGHKVPGYLVPFDEMPKQLCKPSEFREKIAGGGSEPSIIYKNANPFGIPQGTPISDLIANIYMMRFDESIKSIAETRGGRAFRYSDDILLLVKAEDAKEAESIEEEVRKSITSFGSQLIIKESKSSIHYFRVCDEKSDFLHIKGAGRNGLEYLGFRFDGSNVYLRDLTLSNLKRKMTYAGRIRARKHKKRFADQDLNALLKSFNYDHFFQTFMRVEEFDSTSSVRNWTFWTYARRAVEAFGYRGRTIDRQLKFLKPDGKRLIESELSS